MSTPTTDGHVLAIATRALDVELDAEFDALAQSLTGAAVDDRLAQLLLLARLEQLTRRDRLIAALRAQCGGD